MVKGTVDCRPGYDVPWILYEYGSIQMRERGRKTLSRTMGVGGGDCGWGGRVKTREGHYRLPNPLPAESGDL